MDNEKIRQINVEQVVNIPNSDTTNFISMMYAVGSKRKFKLNNKDVERTIANIIETETGFVIYITNDELTQKWIKINGKERITVYYFID